MPGSPDPELLIMHQGGGLGRSVPVSSSVSAVVGASDGELTVGQIAAAVAMLTEADADDVMDELIDRYGDPPRTVNNLISVALMRADAARCGIAEIAQKGMSLNFILSEFDLRRVSALCAMDKYRGKLLFSAGEKPYLSLRLKKGEDALKLGRKLVEEYAATGEQPDE